MNQITEDYCSFEIAQLLKEKGFIELTNAYYDKNRQYYITPNPYIPKGYLNLDSFILCPTHQMALKWLRKVHSIYTTSEPDINDKHCFYPVIYTMTEESWDMQCFEELEKLSFDKPEQAAEAACLYVLKNLI